MRYAIVNIATGEVATDYPGDAIPNPVVWPNGDASHAASLGDERAGFRLVRVERGPDSPGEFYNLTDIKRELSGNVLTYVQVWTPHDLAAVLRTLCARIDETAEEMRAAFITPGTAQSLVYQWKLDEAKAFTGQDDDPKKFPLLSASIGVSSKINHSGPCETIADVAAVVLDNSSRCIASVAKIEAIRLAAKKKILACTSVPEAAAALSAIAWGTE